MVRHGVLVQRRVKLGIRQLLEHIHRNFLHSDRVDAVVLKRGIPGGVKNALRGVFTDGAHIQVSIINLAHGLFIIERVIELFHIVHEMEIHPAVDQIQFVVRLAAHYLTSRFFVFAVG